MKKDYTQYKVAKSIGFPLPIAQYIDDHRGEDSFTAYVVKIIQAHKDVAEKLNDEAL